MKPTKSTLKEVITKYVKDLCKYGILKVEITLLSVKTLHCVAEDIV